MTSSKPQAIVFNCQHNGLNIIQSLGARGIPCVAMDCVRSVGTYSRFARFIRCPNPTAEESRFVDFLYDFCASLPQKPVLFPTNDHWAVAISRSRERLAEVAIPCVASWEAVSVVIEKEKFYELGGNQRYLTPRTWPFEDLFSSDVAYPMVAKPRFRRNASDGSFASIEAEMDRLRLTVINSEVELRQFLQREAYLCEHLIFQEFIHGNSDCMYTVGVYADQSSELKGIFSGRKVRGYPADIGDCIVGESCSLPPDLLDNVARITRELKLCGIMEFEYKQDSVSGQYRLIEVNPRSWSWVGITGACNVDLPWIAYSDLTSQALTPTLQATGIRVRYAKVLQDVLNSLVRYRADYRPWVKSPHALITDYRTCDKVVYAEFNAMDLGPAIFSLAKFCRDASRALARHLLSGKQGT